ncbi:MAG: DUF3122 domain-containing protein [Elainellaceae cyanobacterium]
MMIGRRLTQRLIRSGAIACLAVLLVAIALTCPQPAMARLQQEHLAPQIQLNKSLRTLRDNHGYSWQVIAFRRMQGDRSDPAMLRLVGFPGAVEVDHAQPLQVMGLSDQTILLEDVSAQIFMANRSASDAAQSAAQSAAQNVAQYELQPLLPQLKTTLPLRLGIPLLNQEATELRVSPAVVEEWQQLGG